MLDFRDQDLDDFKTDKEVQDAILMGLRYKEAYEKLLWEKNILISCLCSNKTKVIGFNRTIKEDGHYKPVISYHVQVAPLPNDTENTLPAIWGMDDGKLDEGYSCFSPYSAVQFMLTEMRKWEDENESNK